MIEKVNPSHPDKVADRIAGAMVDLAYGKQDNPRIAVEVLIGHGNCHIIAETSVHFEIDELQMLVNHITNELNIYVDYKEVPQDRHLADNQSGKIRCGDNGIFKGMPLTEEKKSISGITHRLYEKYPTDGKFILADKEFIACQSNANNKELVEYIESLGVKGRNIIVNPLGDWTGGTGVDTGATNRKIGSDMADAVTGGGLHGKDLSKADVSVNIVCHMIAQETGQEVEALCAIGDEVVEFRQKSGSHFSMPYDRVVEDAQEYISATGGFEKLAEWGLF